MIYTPGTDPNYKPSPANPLVYYFHGHLKWPASLVVSEDDYFEFLVNLSKAEPSQIIPRVQRGLWRRFTALSRIQADGLGFPRALPLPHRLAFKSQCQFKHIAVQLGPTEFAGQAPDAKKAEKAARYLGGYFGARNIKVYWGTCQQFITELKTEARMSAAPELEPYVGPRSFSRDGAGSLFRAGS